MTKLVLALLLSLWMSWLCSQEGQGARDPILVRSYKQAELLYKSGVLLDNSAVSDASQALQDKYYGDALAIFSRIAPQFESRRDSLAYHCYLYAGVIHHYFDHADSALACYRKVVALQSQFPSIPDSFLFRPLIFTGIIFYNEDYYDSAMLAYQGAEKIQLKYAAPLEESQRLYNQLGVMYYQTGNYRQAGNYFAKATALLMESNIGATDLLATYQINLATIYIKQEDYHAADSILQKILLLDRFPNEIFHNEGIIKQRLNLNEEAIDNFRKVHYKNSKKSIDLFYNFALAYAEIGEADSAKIYVARAFAENSFYNKAQKNTTAGLLYKFVGDQHMRDSDYLKAAGAYQQAIIQFTRLFDAADVSQNPGQFTGVFSYINLFNTLILKARALEQAYGKTNNLDDLKSSLNAYRAAFGLAEYVEKSYDSDEARLFLNRITYRAQGRPIELSLRLFELTRSKEYLEDAYQFDQQNKASVLSLNIRERQALPLTPLVAQLREEEGVLRTTMTRLSLSTAT